jgi:hypothetical protein
MKYRDPFRYGVLIFVLIRLWLTLFILSAGYLFVLLDPRVLFGVV